MSFLHPAIAWAALASIALPILIHLLFRRRRRPVEWAAMELLREAVRRTNRRLRFEQWLVLALRCLLLLAAGLAIAVPLIGGAGRADAGPRLVMVVVDDGPASGLRVGDEPELSRLVDEVRAMLAGRTQRDRVGVVLASQPARMLLAPTADPGAIEQALARIEASETPPDLDGAIGLAASAIDAERAAGAPGAADARLIVASAFRRASLREGEALAQPRDGSARIEVATVVPARDMPADVRITRVEARPAPSGSAILARVFVERAGASLDAAQTGVRVTAAGMSTPPSRSIAWEKGQSEATVDFQLLPTSLSPTARRVGLEVTLDDDALRAGNAAFAAIDVRRELEVGVVGRRVSLDASDLERVAASLWISRALSPSVGSGMRVRDIDPSSCDDRALLGLDVVVLARPDLVSPSACDAIARFVRAGGAAMVLPSGETLSQPWGPVVFGRLGVNMRIDAEAVEHDPPLRLADEQPSSMLLAAIGPELSVLVSPVETRRTVSLNGFSRGEIVLVHADGTPLVVAQSPLAEDGGASRGLVIAFTAPPELRWCNLPVKPLMVPLFQELARVGAQIGAGGSEATVGELLAGEPGALMRHAAGATLALGPDGRSREIVARSGLWTSDAGSVVAANLAAESLLIEPNPIDGVRTFLEPLGEVRIRSADESAATAGEGDASRATGRWSFMLFTIALGLLLVEGVLSRVFSHASVRRARPVEAAVTLVGRRQGSRGGEALARAREEMAVGASDDGGMR